MAIGNAVQRGAYVCVCNEKGRHLYLQPVGTGSKDGLVDYTFGTVNIRQGLYIYTFDEKGTLRSRTSVS